jgi:para-aminobenzoate synthetase component 2
MIDNYDSFVYNLVFYFQCLNEDIIVRRNDQVTIDEIKKINDLKGIVISPGPKDPVQAGISKEIIHNFSGKIPILGVCLGHQVIGDCYGAVICKGRYPMHGKVTYTFHNKSGLFENIPTPFKVTRYHSLVIDKDFFPADLNIDATSEDDVIMGISHIRFPTYGIQFHPEAVLTEYGRDIIKNFIKICEKWDKHDKS